MFWKGKNQLSLKNLIPLLVGTDVSNILCSQVTVLDSPVAMLASCIRRSCLTGNLYSDHTCFEIDSRATDLHAAVCRLH